MVVRVGATVAEGHFRVADGALEPPAFGYLFPFPGADHPPPCPHDCFQCFLGAVAPLVAQGQCEEQGEVASFQLGPEDLADLDRPHGPDAGRTMGARPGAPAGLQTGQYR